MKELRFGKCIRVGDRVKVGNGFHKVTKIDENYCYVQLNKRSTLRLPLIYSEEFKSMDELDETVYVVYRD